MANIFRKIKILRSMVANKRPTTGSREYGEPYVNLVDKQLGVVDQGGVPQDLLAIRFHSDLTAYAGNELVVHDGTVLRALHNVPAKAFDPTDWEALDKLEVYVDPAAKPNPQPGQLWLDITTPNSATLKVWEGTTGTWQTVGGSHFAVIGHNHDSRYARLTGAQLTGPLKLVTQIGVGSTAPLGNEAISKNYADGTYLFSADATSASAGAADAGKTVQLDANGTLDPSLFHVSVMNFHGVVDATTDPAPAVPAQGDVWVNNGAGAAEGSWGLTDRLFSGDMIIWDGAKWTIVSTAQDLSQYITYSALGTILADYPTRTAADNSYIRKAGDVVPGQIHVPAAASSPAVTNLGQVQSLISAALPRGIISMWSGATPPNGWALCDGKNGTPNLVNRFVLGGTGGGASGGAASVTLALANLPSHSHSVAAINGNTAGHSANHTHGGTTSTVSAWHHHTANTGTVSADHSHSGTVGVDDRDHSHHVPDNIDWNARNTTGGYTGANTGPGPGWSGGRNTGHHHHFGTGGISANHTHALQTGNPSANHTHTFTTSGASANHGHAFTVPAHNTAAAGSGQAFSIMPPYYILAFIMKL